MSWSVISWLNQRMGQVCPLQTIFCCGYVGQSLSWLRELHVPRVVAYLTCDSSENGVSNAARALEGLQSVVPRCDIDVIEDRFCKCGSVRAWLAVSEGP